MRALVTGASGFVGSHLVKKLLDLGHEVVGIDLLPFPEEICDTLFVFKQFDLCDVEKTLEISTGCEVVFHLAAFRSIPRSIQFPCRAFSNNLMSTVSVCEAAMKNKIPRLIFASSSSVYGKGAPLPTTEQAMVQSISPYSASKIAGEEIIRSYTRCYDISSTILRYFNIYGARKSNQDSEVEVIPKFVKNAVENKDIEVYGDGLQTRDFVYVEDVVQANILSMNLEQKEAVFNIGSGETASLVTVLEKISAITNKDLNPRFLKERWGDIRDTKADIEMARLHLGYEPRFNLERGIAKTVDEMYGTTNDR